MIKKILIDLGKEFIGKAMLVPLLITAGVSGIIGFILGAIIF